MKLFKIICNLLRSITQMQTWHYSHANAAHAGMTAHNSRGGQQQRRGKAESLSSSGLRHEVQDSLSELERLIEQQHRQVMLFKLQLLHVYLCFH
jgi:hypothetical protein